MAGADTRWTLEIGENGTGRGEVRMSGVVRAHVLQARGLVVDAHDADFAPQEGRLDLSECLLNELTVAGASYALDHPGFLLANWNAVQHVVERACGVRISSESNSRIEVREAKHIELRGVTLSVPERAVLEDVAGEVTLRRCHGYIAGARDRGLLISRHSFLDAAPLEGAELYLVRLPVGGALDFLTAAVDVARLEPLSESLSEVVRGNGVNLQLCEKLYDVLRERSADPALSDLAAYWVLDARRRAVPRFTTAWWALTIYRILGYARRPARAFVAWGTVGLVFMAWRFVVALRDTSGTLGGGNPVQWFDFTTTGVDIAALFVLLPVVTGGVDLASLRLSPGALLAARVVETLCLIALAAGIRNRLRVRTGRE